MSHPNDIQLGFCWWRSMESFGLSTQGLDSGHLAQQVTILTTRPPSCLCETLSLYQLSFYYSHLTGKQCIKFPIYSKMQYTANAQLMHAVPPALMLPTPSILPKLMMLIWTFHQQLPKGPVMLPQTQHRTWVMTPFMKTICMHILLRIWNMKWNGKVKVAFVHGYNVQFVPYAHLWNSYRCANTVWLCYSWCGNIHV